MTTSLDSRGIYARLRARAAPRAAEPGYVLDATDDETIALAYPAVGGAA